MRVDKGDETEKPRCADVQGRGDAARATRLRGGRYAETNGTESRVLQGDAHPQRLLSYSCAARVALMLRGRAASRLRGRARAPVRRGGEGGEPALTGSRDSRPSSPRAVLAQHRSMRLGRLSRGSRENISARPAAMSPALSMQLKEAQAAREEFTKLLERAEILKEK